MGDLIRILVLLFVLLNPVIFYFTNISYPSHQDSGLGLNRNPLLNENSALPNIGETHNGNLPKRHKKGRDISSCMTTFEPTCAAVPTIVVVDTHLNGSNKANLNQV